MEVELERGLGNILTNVSGDDPLITGRAGEMRPRLYVSAPGQRPLYPTEHKRAVPRPRLHHRFGAYGHVSVLVVFERKPAENP